MKVRERDNYCLFTSRYLYICVCIFILKLLQVYDYLNLEGSIMENIGTIPNKIRSGKIFLIITIIS